MNVRQQLYYNAMTFLMYQYVNNIMSFLMLEKLNDFFFLYHTNIFINFYMINTSFLNTTIVPNVVDDNKSRIINELRLLLSLKPSDDYIIEKIGLSGKKTDGHIDNITVEAFTCMVGTNQFIVYDHGIVHILHTSPRTTVLNHNIIKKNVTSDCVSYLFACSIVENIINSSEICTVPYDIEKAGVGVSVAIFLKTENRYFLNWPLLSSNYFRMYKVDMFGTSTFLNFGYYFRDKDMNIIDPKPFLDYHEEYTRYLCDNGMILYASLTYKKNESIGEFNPIIYSMDNINVSIDDSNTNDLNDIVTVKTNTHTDANIIDVCTHDYDNNYDDSNV